MKCTRRSIHISIATAAIAAATLLSGCHIFVEDRQKDDSWYYCDDYGCYVCDETDCLLSGDYCYDDRDCFEGYCDTYSGTCVVQSAICTVKTDCDTSQICNNGRCAPAPLSCRSDDACGTGAYCSNGSCRATSPCSSDIADADSDASCCVQDDECDDDDEATEPETCVSGATCAEGFCVDGTCGVCSGDCGGGQTCELAQHCGEDRACLNGQCVQICDADSQDRCGSNQTCNIVLGVCVPNQPSGCVHNDECGNGKVCVNNECYVDCTESETCDNASDACSDSIEIGDTEVRLCIPDHYADSECQFNKDCDDEQQCINGICRTACDAPEGCSPCSDNPVCGPGGFCMTEEEATPQCTLNADCSNEGSLCLNTRCVAP